MKMKIFCSSIGISQLIKVDSNENQTFLLQMRAKTLFKLKFDNQLNIIDESIFNRQN